MKPFSVSAARSYLEQLHPTQIDLGLDRVCQLLERLGHPERCAPVLHVAGTNGKGSVCAIAERSLRAAGYRTGFYSSPHLLRFEERIRIDGAPLGDQALAEAVTTVRDAGEGLGLTYFEFGTAMAFVAFRAAGVGAQVIETGLGGRLDATNLVSPVATAITALGLDHVEILGGSLAKIAFEKAGILKPGVSCAVALASSETWPVLRDRAAAVGAELWLKERDFSLEQSTYRGKFCKIDGIEVGLRGLHQRQNAAVALALLEIADRALRAAGLPEISFEARQIGVAQVEWPGRLQVVTAPGTQAGVEVALDGAHNPPAAEALAASVSALWPRRPVNLVFGVLADKQLPPMLSALLPLARRAWLVAPNNPRALPPASYLADARRWLPASETAESVHAGFSQALADAGPGSLVLVCGSLFVVAEAMAALDRLA